MSYPIQAATILADELNNIATRDASNVFVSSLKADAHGEDYRCVVVDVTRNDWGKLRRKLAVAGWQSFGQDGLVHSLPDGNFLVAEPSF